VCELSLVFVIFSDLKSIEKEVRPRTAIRRRNTLDTIIFNEMCDKADKDCENEAKEDVKEGRKSKRSLKLLRGNERDLKLDMEAAHNYAAERYTGDVASTPNQIKVRKREQIIMSIYDYIYDFGHVWKT